MMNGSFLIFIPKEVQGISYILSLHHDHTDCRFTGQCEKRREEKRSSKLWPKQMTYSYMFSETDVCSLFKKVTYTSSEPRYI